MRRKTSRSREFWRLTSRMGTRMNISLRIPVRILCLARTLQNRCRSMQKNMRSSRKKNRRSMVVQRIVENSRNTMKLRNMKSRMNMGRH